MTGEAIREAGGASPDATGTEADIDIVVVVAAFDGDLRAAIRSLLIANEFLMEEVDRLRASLSVGYVRGRIK